MPSDLREGERGMGRCGGVFLPWWEGEAASAGWMAGRTSGGALGEGEGGGGTRFQRSSWSGQLGKMKNLEGASAWLVGVSRAICSSWGRPEKLGVPLPGSCPGRPSARSGPRPHLASQVWCMVGPQ